MKKTALLVLGVLIVAQLLIPVSMILKHERTLRDGTLYRFKTRPIDPADPFQGRYVQLAFENDYISAPTNTIEPVRNERVYVTLAANPAGFCELTGWSRTKPESGDYLKLAYLGPRNQWDIDSRKMNPLGLGFKLPFDRFYMEESKAPRAEKLLPGSRFGRAQPSGTNQVTNCWANVRILNGTALIEDVLVDGTSIKELAGRPRK